MLKMLKAALNECFWSLDEQNMNHEIKVFKDGVMETYIRIRPTLHGYKITVMHDENLEEANVSRDSREVLKNLIHRHNKEVEKTVKGIKANMKENMDMFRKLYTANDAEHAKRYIKIICDDDLLDYNFLCTVRKYANEIGVDEVAEYDRQFHCADGIVHCKKFMEKSKPEVFKVG